MSKALEHILRKQGTVLLRDPNGSGWCLFSRPVAVLQAHNLQDVLPVVAEAEKRVRQFQEYAVGCISYEAAQAFDSALRTKSPPPIPLVWFGLYRALQVLPEQTVSAWPASIFRPTFQTDMFSWEYEARIARIREYIAAGDTYQVNFTLRLQAVWPDAPHAVFSALYQAQPSRFSAFLRLPQHSVCSVSPELFFDLNATTIESRPMKGTRPRGCRHDDDTRLREELRSSQKDRAENLMILDMMRNDLGRIATPGSVRVRSLFDVEKHPTVWQMTSTVEAQTHATIVEILRALFPSASVTGAPKIRTMQVIEELETSPRGFYTGAIGFMAPGPRARFSVAIRTLTLNDNSQAEFGTGGGIVWDSTPEMEYAEAMTKARVLSEPAHDFELLETILWQPDSRYLFEELHLARLAASALYFGYPFSEACARQALFRATSSKAFAGPHRVRLLLNRLGELRTEAQPVSQLFRADPCDSLPTWTLAIARRPVSSRDRFLYHKTTHRQVYDTARKGVSADDVLLWNEHGHVTESTVANLVAVFGCAWATPPVSDGLLAGVFREHLLRTGRLQERTLRLDDLKKADAIYLVNSVRGWIRCHLA